MTTKTIIKVLCGFVSMIVFTACSRGNSIEGEWVEPISGMENYVQGIKLEKNGIASSINMATLQYDKWEKINDKLILSGKSIGNGITISFIDTLIIEKCSDKELVLKNENMRVVYQKR